MGKRVLRAAVSSDIDTLHSIYQGHGLRASQYSYVELRMGLENFSAFLEPFGIKATLFMVGEDFLVRENHDAIRAVVRSGHEIANHTHTHAQGFRLLPPVDQEHEIAAMEAACVDVAGRKPVGFRSPGWNMGDSAAAILQRRGYLYDSSVHPMSLTPLFKFLHWWNTPSRAPADRSTLGEWSYMFAPLRPYRSERGRLARPGSNGLVEFPLTVVPVLRGPFWATFLLATGLDVFRASYRALKSLGYPIQYQFHLSDFVDYDHPDLQGQVPRPTDGVYIPKSLMMPRSVKEPLFRAALEMIACDYSFSTLEEWAGAADLQA